MNRKQKTNESQAQGINSWVIASGRGGNCVGLQNIAWQAGNSKSLKEGKLQTYLKLNSFNIHNRAIHNCPQNIAWQTGNSKKSERSKLQKYLNSNCFNKHKRAIHMAHKTLPAKLEIEEKNPNDKKLQELTNVLIN